MKHFLSLLALTGVLFLSLPPATHGQVEAEADPLAYILSGYSGHVAYAAAPYRASIGVFAADVPEFFHGNEGWSMRARGATVKLDYLLQSPGGWFVGFDGGFQQVDLTLDATGNSDRHDTFGAGVRTGYRVFLGESGLYLVPWVSLSYLFNAEDEVIDGETFEGTRYQIFPTIHVGWRF